MRRPGGLELLMLVGAVKPTKKFGSMIRSEFRSHVLAPLLNVKCEGQAGFQLMFQVAS